MAALISVLPLAPSANGGGPRFHLGGSGLNCHLFAQRTHSQSDIDGGVGVDLQNDADEACNAGATIAPLLTSPGESHPETLPELYVAFDQDANQAGQQAARRLARRLEIAGLHTYCEGGIPAPSRRLREPRSLNGKINRALFTANANSYFTETALRDCKASLGALGKLKSVTPGGENLRGGMTHRTYRAQFENKTLLLNIYLTADGKYEQFLVEDQL